MTGSDAAPLVTLDPLDRGVVNFMNFGPKW